MTGSLKVALSPIKTAATVCSADGDGPYPPNPQLNFQISNFVRIWQSQKFEHHSKAEGAAISSDQNTEVESFFQAIEKIALQFPRYNLPGCNTAIYGFTTAILTQIPWESLPQSVREEKLRRIFANKDFRQRCWQDYLRISQNTIIGRGVFSLGMNKEVASILLEYDDICAELLTLSVVRILLFVQILPQLMLNVVTLAYQLWFSRKLATELALKILNPLVERNNNNKPARDQARFALAEINMAEKKLGDAKPHLDALSSANLLESEQMAAVQELHVGYRGNLLKSLNEFNDQLTEYLFSRQTDGFFYWIGINNKQLSDKKNTLVQALQKDLEKLITDLTKGSESADFDSVKKPVDHRAISNLIHWISKAEAMNNAYYNKYTGYFDGKGSLGDILRSARENFAEFIPKKTTDSQQIAERPSLKSL